MAYVQEEVKILTDRAVSSQHQLETMLAVMQNFHLRMVNSYLNLRDEN